MEKSKLRIKLEECLKEYIVLFEEKHQVCFEFAVSDDLTGILSFGCVNYFHISDVIYDIDNKLEKGFIFDWLNDNIEFSESIQHINLHAYANGLRHNQIKK